MTNWTLRQMHRWLGLVFTLTVLANFIVMAFGKPPAWVVYAPLPPLFLLMFSGFILFMRPYLRSGRGPLAETQSGKEVTP